LGKCIHETPRRSVFISFQRDSTDALLRAGIRAGRRACFEESVTIEPPSAENVPSLFGLFRAVIGAAAANRWLPAEEFLTVITAKDAANRFIGGVADRGSETLALVRASLQTVVVPFSFFERSGDGVTPDFGALSLTDCGHTVAFGEYEASADAIF
jgi:hypothetical protein